MGTPREMFFGLTCISHDYREALEWGQRRIQYLEQQNKAMLGSIKALESHLNDRNKTIDELERELKINQTAVSGKSGESRENKGDDMTENSDEALQQKLFKRLNDLAAHKPTNPESDEDRHQQHRRERMLDEVTLICVMREIDKLDVNATAERYWGRMSRDTAENICDGINDFDAEQYGINEYDEEQ